MFVEVVRLARERRCQKVRANASKRKAMSYGRMLQEEARLKEEIEGLLERAGAVDAEEDERNEEMRGDELPAEPAKRLAAAAAKARWRRRNGRPTRRAGARPATKSQGGPAVQARLW